jgi:hypothetical protein
MTNLIKLYLQQTPLMQIEILLYFAQFVVMIFLIKSYFPKKRRHI